MQKMNIAIKNKFYVKNFENEIKEINVCLQMFKKSGNRDDEAFLNVGDLLIKIKKERQLDDEIFIRLKTHIAKLMGRNGLRNVNKLVSIAQCDVIQKNKDNLPKDWNLLYLLSQTDYLAELIASGMIRSDISADIITKMLAKNQTPDQLSVMPKESDETYTRVDVEKLRFLLTSTSWITTRNIKSYASRPISQRLQ
jgi:hypothetical protein